MDRTAREECPYAASPQQPRDVKVFVINLTRRSDRRAHMSGELAKLGWVATYVDAVDCMAEGFGSKHEEIMRASGLRPGELACYLSHVEAWKQISHGSAPWALLLEDDVTLSAELPMVLDKLLREALPFDVVRLSALQKQVGMSLCRFSAEHALLLPTKHVSGTQGYLISKVGAENLLARIATPQQPIDTTLDRYWTWGGLVAMVKPALIHEIQEAGSDVQVMGRMDASRPHAIGGRLAFSARKWFGIWRARILLLWMMHRGRQKAV